MKIGKDYEDIDWERMLAKALAHLSVRQIAEMALSEDVTKVERYFLQDVVDAKIKAFREAVSFISDPPRKVFEKLKKGGV